jgi:hypothetical protein
MLFFAIISTEKARNHYKGNKLAESVQKLRPVRINVPGMNRTDPLPPPPVKKKNWFVKYELRLPLLAVPLIIVGMNFGLMAIRGQFPERNSFHVDDSIRRSLLVMVCSFILSPGLLILYIWALRVGLIG